MSTIFDSIGIDPGIIIIALLAIVVILIGVMISNGMRLTRLERKYKMFMKGSDAQSLEKTFVRKFAQIDRLYEAKEDHEHAWQTDISRRSWPREWNTFRSEPGRRA